MKSITFNIEQNSGGAEHSYVRFSKAKKRGLNVELIPSPRNRIKRDWNTRFTIQPKPLKELLQWLQEAE